MRPARVVQPARCSESQNEKRSRGHGHHSKAATPSATARSARGFCLCLCFRNALELNTSSRGQLRAIAEPACWLKRLQLKFRLLPFNYVGWSLVTNRNVPNVRDEAVAVTRDGLNVPTVLRVLPKYFPKS